MIFSCPGAKRFHQPEPEDLKCPHCGQEIEIWSDEIQVTCRQCKKTFMRQQEQSCVDWCRYAKPCIGEGLYKEYMKNKSQTIKHRLLEELEQYFGNDTKRISHAKNVMYFAEELMKKENADWHIVIPASILHDVGIKIAEQKYNSSAGKYQQEERPVIAKKILLKVGLKKEDIDEICEIIAYHHTPGKIDTLNFKILYDSDRIVNLKDETDISDKAKLEKIIDKVLLTHNGKALAKEIYLKGKR